MIVFTLISGIIILVIASFILKHTKTVLEYKSIKIKRINRILFIIMAFIPVINILVSSVLLIFYLDEPKYTFVVKKNAFLNKIINYLNEEI